jgi:hypothetical protein
MYSRHFSWNMLETGSAPLIFGAIRIPVEVQEPAPQKFRMTGKLAWL